MDSRAVQADWSTRGAGFVPYRSGIDAYSFSALDAKARGHVGNETLGDGTVAYVESVLTDRPPSATSGFVCVYLLQSMIGRQAAFVCGYGERGEAAVESRSGLAATDRSRAAPSTILDGDNGTRRGGGLGLGGEVGGVRSMAGRAGSRRRAVDGSSGRARSGCFDLCGGMLVMGTAEANSTTRVWLQPGTAVSCRICASTHAEVYSRNANATFINSYTISIPALNVSMAVTGARGGDDFGMRSNSLARWTQSVQVEVHGQGSGARPWLFAGSKGMLEVSATQVEDA